MTHLSEIAVYTCITKGYDKLLPVTSASEGFAFFCFTDRPEEVPKGWQAFPLQSPPRLQDSRDINRFHKIFPYHLFPNHRYSIYVDGNVEYLDGYENLMIKFKKTGCALGAFRHPDMRNPASEAEACGRLAKFDKCDLSRSEDQIQAYKEAGFDLSAVVSANYLLIRDHQHTNMRSAMSLWWSHLFEYTKRDQLSLNFVLWKKEVPFVFLDDLEGVNPEKLQRRPHKRTILKRLHAAVMMIRNNLGVLTQGRTES